MNDDEIKNEDLNVVDEAEVLEYEYNADGEEDLKATIKKLREKLKVSEKEKQDFLANWQRERADFVNYKKDEDTRKIHLIEVARESIILDLLPVLDSYDMAFSNKEAWEKVDKNWRMGVEYIHQQILKVLADYGVTEIAPSVGDTFDPHFHQPIESIKSDENEKDNTIEKLIQKGYKNSKQTLRPARVNVYTSNS